MNLFNFLLNKGTSLQYEVKQDNIIAIDQIVRSLAKAKWKTTVVGNTIFMKHNAQFTPNEILLTGTLIGMIELGEKVK